MPENEVKNKIPGWVRQTLDVLDVYYLKQKPKAPQGYIDTINRKPPKRETQSYHEAQAYMHTMHALEAERISWIRHLTDLLKHIKKPENIQKVQAKIDELGSDKFWVAGKGACMTKAEEHFAYMGRKAPEGPQPAEFKGGGRGTAKD